MQDSGYWKTIIQAALIALIISVAVATIKVQLKAGFGATDLVPFLIWTIPFAVVVVMCKVILIRRTFAKSLSHRYIVFLSSGVAIGIVWTYLVSLYYGPVFLAFSFHLLPCWIAGGASSMLFGIGQNKKGRKFILTEVFLILGICSVMALGSEPLFAFLQEEHQIEVIGIKWLPGPDQLKVEEGLFKLADKDLQELKSLGLTGRISFAGSSGPIGRGKPTRVIILLQHQIKEATEVYQPAEGTIIYLEDQNRLRKIPSDAQTLQRTIRLWPDDKDPARVTRYIVERPDGSQQGGTLFTW